MTRSARITKLGNAIRAYRGAKNVDTQKWIRTPDPSARTRVERWLGELDMDVSGSMTVIDSFRNAIEYYAWIQSL